MKIKRVINKKVVWIGLFQSIKINFVGLFKMWSRRNASFEWWGFNVKSMKWLLIDIWRFICKIGFNFCKGILQMLSAKFKYIVMDFVIDEYDLFCEKKNVKMDDILVIQDRIDGEEWRTTIEEGNQISLFDWMVITSEEMYC